MVAELHSFGKDLGLFAHGKGCISEIKWGSSCQHMSLELPQRVRTAGSDLSPMMNSRLPVIMLFGKCVWRVRALHAPRWFPASLHSGWTPEWTEPMHLVKYKFWFVALRET